jgi:hypothetical protein
MRIAKVVRSVSFANVERGRVVRFFADGKLCTGMKVYSAQDAQDEKKEGMLFLTAHPSYELASIVFPVGDARPPWHPDLLIEFVDASLLMKDFTNLPDHVPPRTGDLTLCHDDKTMLLGTLSGRPKYVDMETGAFCVVNEREHRQPIIVSKWAIVLADGTKEPLVKFGY